VVQWDGSSTKVKLPIESCPKSADSLSNLKTAIFPTSSITYIDLMSLDSNIHSHMQTEHYIYTYSYLPATLTLSITFYRKVDK
jgi:hypothetical protein